MAFVSDVRKPLTQTEIGSPSKIFRLAGVQQGGQGLGVEDDIPIDGQSREDRNGL